MNTYKYSSIFVFTNITLLAIAPYKLNGMFDKLVMLIWLITICISVITLNVIIRSYFRPLKPLYALLIIYMLTLIFCISILSLPDPNKIGFITNFLSICGDVNICKIFILPYLASVVINILFFLFNKKFRAKFFKTPNV